MRLRRYIVLSLSRRAQIYELATGDVLFNPHTSKRHKDMDPTAVHLAQIEGLLGQFPVRFLEKGGFAGHYFSNQGECAPSSI